MQRRSFSSVALVAVGLVCVVAVTAATALAARSAASPFELVVQGRYGLDSELDATFTSGGPFCESGTVANASDSREYRELYTCSDGSGSLTFRFAEGPDWTIVEGSGRYAGLRGKGTYNAEFEELEEGFLTWAFRGKFQGFVESDSVAPSLAFTSVSATKLRPSRLAGWYSVHVDLSLRDDVEGNPVTYRLTAMEGRSELDSREGSTASGSVSTTLQVIPSSKRVRTVQLRLSGSDPVGNVVSIVRSLKLPRS